MDATTGIILGMGSANERRLYNVTLSLTGHDHTQNDPCNKVISTTGNAQYCDGFQWIELIK